jgi:glyoxylase-like metal-dependent hydrolase (beta-lactamase superfamily II)
MRIHPRVEQVSTRFDDIRIELYFVRGDTNILIDAGTREMPQRDILPALEALGLTLSDISLILNTHGHSDHTGGDAAVKAASGAQVFIHGDDAPFLYDPASCFDRYFSPVVKAIGGSSLQTERQAFLEEFGAPVVPDRTLEDGDVIDGGSGVNLQVVHLPGHTPGSVGFYWEGEGILFAGDSLAGLHFPNGKVPIIFDLPTYMKSVQKVQDMPVRYLLCSHYYRGLRLAPGPVRQGEEVSQYLQDCIEFAVRFDEAVRNLGQPACEKGFMQMADEIIAQLPVEMGFKPMTQVQPPLYFSGRTIFSHLDRLYQYGTASGDAG